MRKPQDEGVICDDETSTLEPCYFMVRRLKTDEICAKGQVTPKPHPSTLSTIRDWLLFCKRLSCVQGCDKSLGKIELHLATISETNLIRYVERYEGSNETSL